MLDIDANLEPIFQVRVPRDVSWYWIPLCIVIVGTLFMNIAVNLAVDIGQKWLRVKMGEACEYITPYNHWQVHCEYSTSYNHWQLHFGFRELLVKVMVREILNISEVLEVFVQYFEKHVVM